MKLLELIRVNSRSSICDHSRSSGQVVIVMLILAMIIGVIIPALVYMSRHEAKWTVKETKSTRAFHLAEAGLDRGVFALNGIFNGWNDAKNGIIPSGYTGTTEYTDISGGIYKIKISSIPESNEVTIAAIGKDAATTETRGIKTIYSRDMSQSSIESGGNIELSGNFVVHWGPVKSLQTMQLSGAAAGRYFPRKYARGNITNRTPPSTDDCEYWANAEITDLPEVNLSSYVAMAKAYTPTPENGSTTPATFTEGGYHEGDVTFRSAAGGFRDWEEGLRVNGVDGVIAGSTPTYYVTGNVILQNNTFIKGNLICEGNITFQGSGWANTNAGDSAPNYMVFIPNNARKEYYHADGLGSCGKALHADARTVWDDASWVNGAQVTLNGIKFHGFIYAGGNITGTSNPPFVGVIICQGTADNLGGTSGVYYDTNIADNVTYQSQKFVRISWLEFVPGSWSNPNW